MLLLESIKGLQMIFEPGRSQGCIWMSIEIMKLRDLVWIWKKKKKDIHDIF